MADSKTSALTAAGSALAADEIHVNEAGTSKKVTISQTRTLIGQLSNASAASQTPFSSDTYLTGSSISIPSTLPIVGSSYNCIFDVTKTAAGVAAPVLTLRIGTAGSTADASICAFTFSAQTAVIDSGMFEVWATYRTVGSGTSAVVQGIAQLHHQLAVTGLGTVQPAGMQMVLTTSSGFNSTTASQIIGLSVNGGASAAWTVQLVRATAYNL